MRFFIIVLLIYVLVQYIISAVNYVKNIKLDSYGDFGLIENQRSKPASDLRFALKNSGYNGCGWIACYNAFLLLDKQILPRNAILMLELLLTPVCLGFLGTNPLSIVLFLKLCGYRVKLNILKQDSAPCDSNVGILLYMTRRRRAHYVAYQKTEGGLEFHNSLVKCSSFTEYIDRVSGRFIMSIDISSKKHN